jgi:predicted nucleic acid-binding protein
VNPPEVPDGPLLVDADVFSYWYRQKGAWKEFSDLADGHPLAMSFACVGEILAPTYGSGFSKEVAQRIQTRLANFVVIPYDYDVVERWAAMANRLREQLKGKGVNDLWTAACAISQKLPLLTNNLSDFQKIQAEFPSLVIIHPSL